MAMSDIASLPRGGPNPTSVDPEDGARTIPADPASRSGPREAPVTAQPARTGRRRGDAAA